MLKYAEKIEVKVSKSMSLLKYQIISPFYDKAVKSHDVRFPQKHNDIYTLIIHSICNKYFLLYIYICIYNMTHMLQFLTT